MTSKFPGTDGTNPIPCDCSKPEDGTDDSYCQVFDFMVGAIFYNGPSALFSDEPVSFTNASDVAVMRLLNKHTIEDITRMSFNISFAAIDYGRFVDPVWRENAYDFCTLDDIGACSILIFNPFGRESNSVSEYYYQVPFPACRDTFSVNLDSW